MVRATTNVPPMKSVVEEGVSDLGTVTTTVVLVGIGVPITKFARMAHAPLVRRRFVAMSVLI